MKKYTRLFLIGIMVVVVLTTYGQTGSAFEVKLVDDLGREVIIEEEPARIVSLAPNITEILYELNLEDKIVGVTDFCDYPEEAKSKNKVGVKNLESIIGVNPDLIIAAGIVPKETIDSLEKLGITVVGFNPKTINDTITTIDMISKVTGRIDKGEELTEELTDSLKVIADEVTRVLKEEGRPKVFYEVWKEPLYTVGKNTFINDLIKVAGGYNVGVKAQGPWPQYSLEQLIVDNPDVYIATYDSWKDRLTADKIKARDNYQDIKAIKEDRIYIVDANIINRPGPRIIEALRIFVKAIHPQIDLEN